MRTRTLLEEICRIIQINEHMYDDYDVPRGFNGIVPRISRYSIKDAENDERKKVKLPPAEKMKKNRVPGESRILDINNPTDKMKIFAHLSNGHTIKSATDETLKMIDRLTKRKYQYDINLHINRDLELEYGYYLLKFNKYDDEILRTRFDGLHLSPTFNNILNTEGTGFKRKIVMPFEDFKNFMTSNKDVFEDEIVDFIKNKKGSK